MKLKIYSIFLLLSFGANLLHEVSCSDHDLYSTELPANETHILSCNSIADNCRFWDLNHSFNFCEAYYPVIQTVSRNHQDASTNCQKCIYHNHDYINSFPPLTLCLMLTFDVFSDASRPQFQEDKQSSIETPPIESSLLFGTINFRGPPTFFNV